MPRMVRILGILLLMQFVSFFAYAYSEEDRSGDVIEAIADHAVSSAKNKKDYEEGEWQRGFFMGLGIGKSFFPNVGSAERVGFWNFDFQMGYDARKYLAVGIKVGVIGGEERIQGASGYNDIDFVFADLFVKFKPIYARFSPYLLCGLGGYDLVTKYSEDTGHFHLQGGAGIEFNISRRNSLGAEAIYHFLQNSPRNFHAVNLNLVYRYTF